MKRFICLLGRRCRPGNPFRRRHAERPRRHKNGPARGRGTYGQR